MAFMTMLVTPSRQLAARNNFKSHNAQGPISSLRIKGSISTSFSHIGHRASTHARRAVLATGLGSNGAKGSGENGNGADSAGEVDETLANEFMYGIGVGSKPIERPEDAPDRLSREQAAQALAMGTWRLRPRVCPVIEALVAQVEASWRVALKSDLSFYPLPKQYKYMDSLDPEGAKAMAHSLPDPPKEDPGWPRLQVENRAYQSHAFRKMHLEVAVRQDELQVLHCVIFPRLEFALPILSIDLVVVGNRTTLAIIDPCPVTQRLTLPPFYTRAVRELQQKYGVASNRGVPDWGSAIFSKECVCMRPEQPSDVAAFLKYAIALANFHAQIGRLAAPVQAAGVVTEEAAARQREEIKAAHVRYCARQLENDKTRKVLEKAFGSAVAEDYMHTVMFDVEQAA